MAARSRLGPAGYGIRRNTSFAGKILDLGIIVDPWIIINSPTPSGIQKPGIPSGTEAWLKTVLEIMMGRRGNAIDIPETPDLTFSSTPTQEECQALYESLKETRALLKKLTERFDS